MTTNCRSLCLLKPKWLQWPYFAHKGTPKEAQEAYFYTTTRFHYVFEQNCTCNVLNFSLCLPPPPRLSPVPPTDRKVSRRRRLCRERAGVKSAWFAPTRPQAVTMEFSPAVAARSSSKEQSKVRAHAALLTLGGCDELAPHPRSQPLNPFAVVGLSHNHSKVKDGVTVNEVFPSLKC